MSSKWLGLVVGAVLVVSIVSGWYALYTNKPSWAVAGANIALVIITAWYSHLVREQLIELQKQTAIYQEQLDRNRKSRGEPW